MPADLEFERLVQLYYRDLYRFGFSLTRSEADAADLTQQTFYIWANKGHQLRKRANVKTWLFTTLHREFLQARRRRERVADQPVDDALEEASVETAADVVSSIDIQTMLELFATLDQNYQAPLALYYVEELSYKEIAKILEIPIGTVQSRIARGKIHLHSLLIGDTASKTTAKTNG